MANLVLARLLGRQRLPFLDKMSGVPSNFLGFAAIQRRII
jgi:hypothetical protein